MKVLRLLSLLLFVIGLPAAASAVDHPERRPSPTLASLPLPTAAGGLRILLVDDDLSDNNNIPGDSRLSISDRIFRQLVAEAVGGDAAAWAIETVKPNANGPDLDRLRKFSLILWYTGASYGGNPDNSAVLSVEDEKTVRRYLEETGGAVVLVSPGYVSKVLDAGGTWESSTWPFLSEVLGIRGGKGLAQRFESSTVTASDGAQFTVGKGSAAVESQFSTVNPDGATVVFTAVLTAAKKMDLPTPVATASSYGRGRIIYVGFTFENLVEKDRTPAFRALLSATGLQSKAGVAVAGSPAPPTNSPEAEPATVQVSGTPTSAVVSWTMQTATILNASPGGPAQTTKKALPKPAPAQAPTVKVERLVPNAAPVRLNVASPDALKTSDPGPLTPGRAVTYRVTLTDARGLTGSKDASFIPPMPKDPTGLTAATAADGSVTLSWQAVADTVGYQVTGTTLTAPVVVTYATQWKSPPQTPGSQQWKVASRYEPGGVLTAASAWPSVMTRVVPTPRLQYLSLPNGTGSGSESEAHYRAQCAIPGEPIDKCVRIFDILKSATNFEAVWFAEVNGEPVNPQWSIAAFADLRDLGLGRRVNCIPRNGGMTLCWATSHGHVPAADAGVNGEALAGLSDIVTDIKSINIIMISGTQAFFGTWEDPSSAPRLIGGSFGPFDREFSYAKSADPVYGTALDSQGRKSVPQACLSCHGGRFDTSRKVVVGASLLPLIPAHLTFSSPQARINSEEQIRRINQIVLESNPSPTISAQINALYNGTPGTPNTRANDAAVPAGWASQPGLYKQVIAPYCGSCHFSQTGPLNFATFANVQGNKQRIQQAVCVNFSMPHSEQGFRRFWTEGGPVSLPGLLSTVLGYPKCPQ